jgi:predicted unusual protein kinase regulating ubiquinone biosynthesis (AarF/ABC1/UbiB family)
VRGALGNEEPITSAFRRFVKLGGLMGRVGASMLGNQIAGYTRSDESDEVHTTEALVRNATRVVKTLGEMKGAAMKVGQMLSLHDALLPPEVAAVLRTLQKQAPKVPSEVMEYEVRGQLKNFDELFESLEPEAFAAASIGQVHMGRLRDGRRVAVKIQYPLIDQIIQADLKNLKRILGSLFSMFSKIDFEPVWREVRDRLLEELDYNHEAANMRRMAELHAGVPEIIIPRVVDEASARGVLTMEYVPGLPPEVACSDRFEQQLKDRWGRVMFEFLFRGLLEHRFLHADPNLANFAFREDGSVVVYDFGCVKTIPDKIVTGYSALFRAVIEGRHAEVPGILLDLEVSRQDGTALPRELVDPYIKLIAELYREEPPYTFGENEDIYRDLFSLGVADLTDAMTIRFPEDVIFIDRALGGHFGNFTRLGATGPWGRIVLEYARKAASA